MKTIRIAAVIFHSPRNQVSGNLARMDRWIGEAKRAGAAMICFPELNITGYGVDPGIREAAEPLSGEVGHRLGALAERHQVIILAGLVEKEEDGKIFASHLVVDPQGPLGVYRKVHIAPPERNAFNASVGSRVFEAAGTRFGIQLCYDAHFPEFSTRMALDGADVIFMPHASPRGTPEEKSDSWMRHLPARAFDNGVFVVACNQTGDNGAGLTFPGLAMVIGPDGRLIAVDVGGREALLLADLDLERLAAIRSHPMRYFLPNRRPDIYRSNG